ncbi:MAG: hypothetical protein QF898_09290 [SAR202 cluster bacterium]|jgi:plasmid stability protein|nr:hypothetical protein [SAR202 cluster bacterium]MDP6514288.1 hypothetical protein [SAR202 cluster bacterium]
MSKRMTVVFDDEELYRAVKIEAARSGRHAKDIIAEAVRAWLEVLEDRELGPEIDAAIEEWEREGGIKAEELFSQLRSEAQTES